MVSLWIRSVMMASLAQQANAVSRMPFAVVDSHSTVQASTANVWKADAMKNWKVFASRRRQMKVTHATTIKSVPLIQFALTAHAVAGV